MRRLIALTISIVLLPVCLCAMTLDIEADTLEKIGDWIEARGNVVATGENMVLMADYVIYDSISEDIWATGSCDLRDEKGTITADVLYYNSRSFDVYMENGSVLVYAEPMIISGKSVVRYGEDLYFGTGVTFTPCLGKAPSWSIAASSMEIPIEGYARAKNARLKIRKLPVIYSPYLLYPAKLKRQTGLLVPEIGHSSDTGYYYGQPLYLTLGDSADLTITPTHLSKRGLLVTGEFRYRPDYETSGMVYFETLHDKLSGDEMQGVINKIVPSDRWYLKAKHKGHGLSWDINLVSNEDYFRDIGTFYKSEEKAASGAVEGLSDDEDELISRFEWNLSGNGFSAGVSGQWKQDLTIKGDDKTLQELPKLRARMSQRDIPFTPVKVSSELSSTRVYSREWVEAVKDYGQVELSMPLNVFPYFTIRPYVKEKYRDTYFTKNRGYFNTDTWSLEKQPFIKDSYNESWQERGTTINTSLYSRRFAGGYYHQVVPQVGWSYLTRHTGNYDPKDPLHNRDDYPELLTGDDWNKTFDMNLSLANYIRNESGRSVLDVRLSRKYSYLTKEWDRAEAKLKMNPVWWMSLEHTNKFGRNPMRPYATHEHTTSLGLRDNRGDQLSMGLEYNRIDTKSVNGKLKLNIAGGFSATCEAKYDYDSEHESMRRRFDYVNQGLRYEAQCWSIDLGRLVEPTDEIELTVDGEKVREHLPRETTVYLRINLLGLGDVVSTSHKMGE